MSRLGVHVRSIFQQMSCPCCRLSKYEINLFFSKGKRTENRSACGCPGAFGRRDLPLDVSPPRQAPIKSPFGEGAWTIIGQVQRQVAGMYFAGEPAQDQDKVPVLVLTLVGTTVIVTAWPVLVPVASP